jgi:hypothetical protein
MKFFYPLSKGVKGIWNINVMFVSNYIVHTKKYHNNNQHNNCKKTVNNCRKTIERLEDLIEKMFDDDNKLFDESS